MRVMIIEDEQEVRDLLRESLSEYFDLSLFEDGQNLTAQLEANMPDVILLDQRLPGKSGADCIREIRAHSVFSRLPIIMVTGLKSEEDKVAALELGADDYVTKPFMPKELVARIRAVYRHTKDPSEPDKLVSGNLNVDLLAHKVTLDGGEVLLTLTEFNILKELLKKAGHVLSREKLREKALGNLNVTDRTIDVHMASLRKKLNAFGDKIETVRGVGYRFSPNN